MGIGTKIYGVLASEVKDSAGEILKISGLQTDNLKSIIDEHVPEGQELECNRLLGVFTFNKKIFSEKDCDTPRQKLCWDRVKAPLLYVEGELADGDGEHTGAKSAAALLRFCQRPDIPLVCGLSVDGGILDRRNESGQPDEKGTILAGSVALAGAWTIKPANKTCFIAPMNDLQKSDFSLPPPAAYFAALKKSQASHSIYQRKNFELYLKLDKLKKSLDDYLHSFTSMKCKKCGTGIRFFKSSQNIPSVCHSCGSNFSITDIWQSLNKSKKGK